MSCGLLYFSSLLLLQRFSCHVSVTAYVHYCSLTVDASLHQLVYVHILTCDTRMTWRWLSLLISDSQCSQVIDYRNDLDKFLLLLGSQYFALKLCIPHSN